MPYVDFESNPDDFVSLWYNTNAAFNNIGSFDPNRPTILFFHPTLLDTQWLNHHFADPRLSGHYNMIAFDMRVCGRSNCRHSGRHDSWVEAADIGRAHHALHLPPVHVIGVETIGCNAAIRFAALFPDICLSLILCNAPPPTELKESFDAYDEALHSWCYAEDIDSFEKYGVDAVSAMLGPPSDPPLEQVERARVDLEVELITYWELFMPPTRRQRVLEQINVILNRKPLTPEVLSSITQPVLLIHVRALPFSHYLLLPFPLMLNDVESLGRT
jgi:pimeloyl-ACP methyl ester carboxylesterase